MIGVIDYGMGNLLSVFHALEMVGGDPVICKFPEDIKETERLVLPGVGAFRDCTLNLNQTGFAEALYENVLKQGKPILAICLGMQVLARKSFEGGEYDGLNWIDSDVVRLNPRVSSLRVPHVGWNNVQHEQNGLFEGIPDSTDFYFVHSYYMKCMDKKDIVASCDYGGRFTAAVLKNNIFATQFHPEKSQDHGLRLLENFLKWKP